MACSIIPGRSDRPPFLDAEALEAATASLSVEAQKRAATYAQRKTAKAEAAEQRQADKLAKSIITVKRIERNNRKFVTSVSGLEAFGLELKKVCPAAMPDAKTGFATADALPPRRCPRSLARSLRPAPR